MEATRYLAGHIIRSGGITSALRIWRAKGQTSGSWHAVRRNLRALFPEAQERSIDAVVRYAQRAAAVGRLQQKNPPDWVPPVHIIPDVRRVVKDALAKRPL